MFALERRKGNRDHRSWADFAEEKSISLGAKEHLSKTSSSGTFLVTHRILAFIFLVISECLMLYWLVWTKRAQILMLKLVLCVFAMILIQLMLLILFDVVHVKNLFWIILPFYKCVTLFPLVLLHPNLELSSVSFFGLLILWRVCC